MSKQSSQISLINFNLTSGIFCFLFLVRLASGFVLATTHGDGYPIFTDFITIVSLASITLIILLNRWNLSDLNIDRLFIYIFLLACLLLVLYFSFSLISGVAIICLILTLRSILRYMFELTERKNYQAFLYMVLGIAPVILIKLFAHKPSAYENAFLNLNVDQFSWIINIGFWNVVFEEFLFRGLLWMLLSKWMSNNMQVIITQAFLFWLVHLNLIARPFYGIHIVLFGLWLGYLTLRSKSLIPSTITHFIWNITANVMTII